MWLRQTPILAVMVFGIGVGLGLAWKSGLIPVELGEANKGALLDSEMTPLEETSPAVPTEPAAPSDIPDIVAQTEPEPSEDVPLIPKYAKPMLLTADPASRPVNRPERVAPAAHRDADVPEWAKGEQSPASEQVSAANDQRSARNEVRVASVEQPVNRGANPNRSTSNGTQRPREIQLAANQTADKEVSVTPPDRTATPIDDELKEIDAKIANDDYLTAHRALSKLYWNHKELRPELLKRLHHTSRVIFFEPQPHFVEPYVVQPNDRLSSIASKYNLSWEYVAKLNRTEPRRIQQGQKIKIMKGPFAAVVDLNEFALTIHLQGYFVKKYEVGIGKDGASPLGKFTVLNKVENPQYTGPDGKVISADSPLNPLGERWIDLGDSYGIHGTIEPESIGKAASRGCIRMREKDVIEVYDFLVKGSEVTIRK
ncbi:MAG: L,D-transpeptidase family protein [Planctomycetota bacterium]